MAALTFRRTGKSSCLNVCLVRGTSCQEALYCTTQAQIVYRWSVGVGRLHDEFRRAPKEQCFGLVVVVTCYWKPSPRLKRPLSALNQYERANSTDGWHNLSSWQNSFQNKSVMVLQWLSSVAESLSRAPRGLGVEARNARGKFYTTTGRPKKEEQRLTTRQRKPR